MQIITNCRKIFAGKSMYEITWALSAVGSIAFASVAAIILLENKFKLEILMSSEARFIYFVSCCCIVIIFIIKSFISAIDMYFSSCSDHQYKNITSIIKSIQLKKNEK